MMTSEALSKIEYSLGFFNPVIPFPKLEESIPARNIAFISPHMENAFGDKGYHITPMDSTGYPIFLVTEDPIPMQRGFFIPFDRLRVDRVAVNMYTISVKNETMIYRIEKSEYNWLYVL